MCVGVVCGCAQVHTRVCVCVPYMCMWVSVQCAYFVCALYGLLCIIIVSMCICEYVYVYVCVYWSLFVCAYAPISLHVWVRVRLYMC